MNRSNTYRLQCTCSYQLAVCAQHTYAGKAVKEVKCGKCCVNLSGDAADDHQRAEARDPKGHWLV